MGQSGPADQFAKELARGDFKKAAEQLKELQEKLEKGKMTLAEKKALQEQLGEMTKKLKAVANMEERKKQLDEALKNGGLSKEQYEREMEKLKQQSKSLKQLQQLAEQARPGAGGPQEGRHQAGRRVAGHDPAAALRDGQAARGDGGTRQRNGRRDGRQERDERRRHEPARPEVGGRHRQSLDNIHRGCGQGLGRGRGQGDRPEAPDETATYSTKVEQQIRKGKAVLQGFTQPSKTVKGESEIDIQAEMEAGTASAADALSNQKIPKNVEKHIRAYYDQINKGK